MLIKTTNHYLNRDDMQNALALDGRNYIELDGIRLVIDNHEIVGWYNPNREDCSARNDAELEQNVPSEEVSA